MNTTRFITVDELDYLRITYPIGKKSLGDFIDQDRQDNIISNIEEKMTKGIMHVAMIFDTDNNPIASFQALEFPRILGWRWAGISSVTNYSHFNITAKIFAPAFDLVINHMESKGYYKFWAINSEVNLNILYKSMCNYSVSLKRYTFYDEMLAPKSENFKIPMFDKLRRPIRTSNALARLYILDQKHRIELLKKHGYDDYQGTVDI